MKGILLTLAFILVVIVSINSCSKKAEPPPQVVRPKINKPVVLAQNFPELTNPSTEDEGSAVRFEDVPDDIEGITEEEAELLEPILD